MQKHHDDLVGQTHSMKAFRRSAGSFPLPFNLSLSLSSGDFQFLSMWTA